MSRMSLDNPKIDTRPIADDKCVVLKLPRPIPVNAMYRNVNGVGRVMTSRFREWKKAASDMAWFNPRSRFTTPVKVTVVVESKARGDIDGYLKGPLDHLVNMGVIQDDGPKYVFEVTGKFGDVVGCEVTVERAA